MSIAIIINPISGGARPDAARARAERAAAVTATRDELAEVFVTERPGHARELAKAAVARHARLVVAWGGDGTINEVASALAFEDVPLGIMPSGSGNGLARELGIDPRPEQALVDALGARPRPMDIGELDGHPFVNIAGVGFDAYVAARFNGAGNRRRGLAGYASIAARALISYAPATYSITLPDEQIRARAILVNVANSAQFGNDARIAPGAVVDDGLLDLVVVAEKSRLSTLWNLSRMFTGTVGRTPGYTHRPITQATIECDRPMVFHVDGETFEGGTRLRARVHPGALQIAVR